ncbi:MAG: OsmC family protein [Thermoleophilia bacterium]|nr:OsmC family protein [Thermoleophilia bacterium]
MTGTFGGALEARHVDASGGKLTSEATGEVESDDGVLVIRRIHVAYTLRVAADIDRAAVERAFDRHMPYCPVYRSIGAAIEITTAVELVQG